MKLMPPPGPERRRQMSRLIVLVALLVIVLWLWMPAGTPPPSSNQPVVPATGPAGQLPQPEIIRLDTLQSVSELPAVERNPFVFGQRESEPSAPGTSFLTTPQPSGPPVPPPPPVPQGPPAIPLRLTGMTVTEPGGPTLVTLKDSVTNALYQAREGDIVDGRYRVVKVGVTSVVVSYLDGSGIRTLPLGS